MSRLFASFPRAAMPALACAGLACFAAPGAARAESAVIRPDATMLQFPDVSADSIVFVYANDLWLVPKSGGTAVKIASPPGQEMMPKFSPDGKNIAFTGNYEGNKDLYTVPISGAGVATRITHHPAAETLCDWSPDGSELIFYFNGMAGLPRQQQLFTVDASGGLPRQMPVPYGTTGSISADGSRLAYTPHTTDFRTWKRYRGGMATDIWLFDLKQYTSKRMTDWEGTDTTPMWSGDVVYYLSDAGPEHRLNIWSYDTKSGDRKQVTTFKDFDVKWPSIGPGEIVFQNGPQIHLLELRSGKVSTVEIEIPGDRPTLRPHQVNFAEFIASGNVSATGKRGVVEARGDIWTLPAEKGVVRNLTNTDGVAERNPIWSPDGKWIAYLSDATGEYEIWMKQSDGKGETRQLTKNGTCWRYLDSFSPDSKMICFLDKTGAIYLLTIETGETTLVATDPWANQQPVSWSHDSKWLAFSLGDPDNQNPVVHVYNIEKKELTPVTSNMFASTWPTFDRRGEWLFFASNRSFSPTYSDIDTTFIYKDTDVLLAVPINKDVKNPWLAESDEEEWKKDEDGKDEDRKDEADKQEGDDESQEKEADEQRDDGNADEADGSNGGEGGEDSEETDSEEDESEESEYDTEHPLHGIWKGVVKGLKTMGLPEDEAAFSMTIFVSKDGGISGSTTVTIMGQEQSEDLGDEVTFDRATGAFHAKSVRNGMTSITKGTLKDSTITGTWEIVEMGLSGTWEATKSDEKPDTDDDKKAKPVKIDFEGFEARAMLLPVPSGAFSQLAVNDKNQLLYMRGGGVDDDDNPIAAGIKLFDMEKEEDGEKNVLAGVFGFSMSGDGKKIGVQGHGGMAIVDAAPGQSMAKTVPTDRMKRSVDPRAEWKQIFTDAWRVQRDFFYDAGMHGVDWEAVRKRYEPMLADCVTREDVSFVIREMISELNVGHAYYWGGDVEREPAENVGMLGCDFERVTENGSTAYRIKKIIQGAAWDADARGPLSQPGIDVKEGDFLLAVNGTAVDASKSPWAAFIGLADAVVELTVSESPVIDDKARRVLVKTIPSETNLRYRAWIEEKRRYVDYRTNGRIGYIYVPNTGVDGQNDLYRQFYGQRHKAGLIIDERWNGGGQIPTRFIELLNRPRTNYWARRDGKDWPWPPDSHQGPKCMLINGLAGSGGDMFPALFRQAGLGKLIGMRTWGGLVGISGNPSLIDGGYTSAPTFGFYETDGTWGIEGHGVDPDIEVIDDPAQMVNGGDPQLDAAIAHIQAEVERAPYTPPSRPKGPDRSGMGLPDADK